MTSKAKLNIAMQIMQGGPPLRARANEFGWTEAQFRSKKRHWKWAMRVLERQPCSARRRRDGKPCQALNEPGSARCRWHGGCSTGPKTPEGRARALANLRQYARQQ